MKGTAIEWAHHTVNFWWGCAMALLKSGDLSEECRECYAKMMAETLNFSLGKATWGRKGRRWLRVEAAFGELIKLDISAGRRGVRERVFINSMSDTFEERVDLMAARGVLLMACAEMKNLDCLLLTKRPENVRCMVPAEWMDNWPAHVWIGTTTGTQASAAERIPPLLGIPAKVRFLSVEPLLEAVHIPSAVYGSERLAMDEGWGIHWVICGGESGPRARPLHPALARSLRDQCKAAGVPFFFKQWGEHDENGKRMGKKRAGRLLDGVEHNAVPEVQP